MVAEAVIKPCRIFENPVFRFGTVTNTCHTMVTSLRPHSLLMNFY